MLKKTAIVFIPKYAFRFTSVIGGSSVDFLECSFACDFSNGLLDLVHRVLTQKESQSIDERNKWFQDEAIKGDNIQECGTFRRALSYRIEKEVVPIFSCIIDRIDSNSNLALISENIEWKVKLWLQLFQCKDFVQLDFKDLSSPVEGDTSARKQRSCLFTCWFPFSDVVCSKVSSVVNTQQNNSKFNFASVKAGFHSAIHLISIFVVACCTICSINVNKYSKIIVL